MVRMLVFDPHVKVIIPRNKTLLLDAQNTQDHRLALHWTRDMPPLQVSGYFISVLSHLWSFRAACILMPRLLPRRPAVCSGVVFLLSWGRPRLVLRSSTDPPRCWSPLRGRACACSCPVAADSAGAMRCVPSYAKGPLLRMTSRGRIRRM